MSSTPKKVLIVEDERALAHALELKLLSQGFSVTVANDGQEALDQLQAGVFDVILLDLMMPKIDGFQVLEKLRSKPRQPVVFVLSNLSQPEDEARVIKLGARKFFIKSDTSLSEIVNEINQA